MAIKEIKSITAAPNVRADAWWVEYLESEPAADDDTKGNIKLLVKGKDALEAQDILIREYTKKWGNPYMDEEVKAE